MAPSDNQMARQVAEMIIAELTPVYVIGALLGLGIATAAVRRNMTDAPVPARRVRSTLLIGALVFKLWRHADRCPLGQSCRIARVKA
ncbi:hypothetical protein [Sphingomonas phyllosphaerae]|uniref:hypothetical protein n=1 Tax=Sphingomonas phyllosphaerae TaxID=257003 RepID=UPI0024137E8B|nr:hypothetical protein [Sphingomonas phyllosphaerae]